MLGLQDWEINSTYLPELRQFGITERVLYDNLCANVNVGAWILAKSIAVHGYTWRAVGSYNTGVHGRESNREKYVQRVMRNISTRDLVGS